MWLRVDSNNEDALIESFINAAEDIVAGILRFPLGDFMENVPEPVKHAIYFAVSKLYEERNDLDADALNEVLKALLFSYRKVEW
jgi:hypothetical protein